MPPRVVAAVMPAPEVPIELREFPVPELPPGGVLLDTTLSEVCGTDVHLFHGRLSGVPYPIIPGHVSVGRAARIHGEARTLHGERLREGDRVAFSTSTARAGAATPVPLPERPPGAPLAGSTASPIRRPRDCSAAGPRPSISSLGC